MADDGDDGDDDESSDFAADIIRVTATTAGTFFVEEGRGQSQVARMYRMELRELAESIDNGVAPVLVEFEGEIIRLTGSMEAQYSGWREILRHILATETGLSDQS